jgi:predicted MPP superfamily phosphohydrolase
MYFVFAGITVFMIAGLAGFTNSVKFSGSIIYRMAALTMGMVLYLFMFVILVDLLSLVVKLKPIIQGTLVLTLTLGTSLYGFINSYHLRKTEIEISVPGLTKELRAVHLSDIHLGHFRGKRFMERIKDKTNSMNPDMVFITGDLFDGKIKLNAETLEPIKGMKSPVYFVEGNHDGYSGVQKIKKLMRDAGSTVLENEVLMHDGLQVVGLNHMLPDSTTPGMHATLGRETMKNILPGIKIDKDKPSVLLHHSPDGIQYASAAGIDLYLSGHTHAGQLFPITLLNELIFKYNKGLDKFNNTRIFVHEGVGTFGPPMRVGTRSEIVFIKLVPQN